MRRQPVIEEILRFGSHSIHLCPIAHFDPQEYYQHLLHIGVQAVFAAQIVDRAKPVWNLPPIALGFADVLENVPDLEIRAQLPEGFYFDPAELCARMPQMLERQMHGEEGDLLVRTVGIGSNCFYVPERMATLKYGNYGTTEKPLWAWFGNLPSSHEELWRKPRKRNDLPKKYYSKGRRVFFPLPPNKG